MKKIIFLTYIILTFFLNNAFAREGADLPNVKNNEAITELPPEVLKLIESNLNQLISGMKVPGVPSFNCPISGIGSPTGILGGFVISGGCVPAADKCPGSIPVGVTDALGFSFTVECDLDCNPSIPGLDGTCDCEVDYGSCH